MFRSALFVRLPRIGAFVVLVLLVCAACPVSVSVRPGRFCVTGSTRDSGHHSRFVQSFLLLATAAPVLGVDGAFLLEAGPSG